MLISFLFNPSIATAVSAITILFFILITYIILEKISSIQRKAKHSKELLELQHTFEQTLLKSQLEIQEETLRNISQEIHDNIGQVLSLAKLQLNTFPFLPTNEAIETVSNSKDLVSKAIADLRSLSKSLHPDRVNELGLEENIRHELEMLEKTRQYTTRLKINGSPFKIPVQTQTILFRIVQEAISNIIKHAAANKVDVVLDYEIDQFCVTVQDNGVGLPNNVLTAPESGIGLKNMKNRSAILGATFSLSPVENGGTAVCISVPIATTA